jgi:hypothetical protein
MTDAAAAPPSFWRAVGLTFEATVRNARTCLALVSAYAVLNGISNAIGRTLSVGIDPLRATGTELVALSAAFVAGIGTYLVIYTFVYPPTLGALSLVGAAAETGDELATHGIVRRVFDRALEVIGAFVLTILILAAAPIAVAVVALLAGLIAGPEGGIAAMLFMIILLAPPTVYVFVRLSLAVPVVVQEGLSPVQALRRSWNLVGGSWWWVFGVMVIAGIVGGVIGNVASTIISLGNTGVFTVGREGPSNYALAALGTAISTAVSGSIFGVATGIVYAARAQSLPPAELPLPEAPTADASTADSSDE